jgi:hypothetical protein
MVEQHAWEEENCIHAFGKYTRIIKPLIKIRHGQDIIKTDLKEIWWNSMNWINVAQDVHKWRSAVGIVL